jgi:membrane protein DedA with SNARE-associated domain
MPLIPFIIYSTIGTALWVSFLTGAGYLLGENYDSVDKWLGPVSKIVLLSLVIGFGLWIIRKNMRKSAE